MSTPDELLAHIVARIDRPGYCRGGMTQAWNKLHAECSKGNLPSEYLKALAKRARDAAEVANTPSMMRHHLLNMADTLEAWADE